MVTHSCVTLFGPMNCSPPGSSVHGNSPGNTGVGSLSLFQGSFPTQGPNPDLPHCRRILYHLSHQGSLRILKWVAYPFSSGPSWSRNWTGVPCITGRFFTSWATREAPHPSMVPPKPQITWIELFRCPAGALSIFEVKGTPHSRSWAFLCPGWGVGGRVTGLLNLSCIMGLCPTREHGAAYESAASALPLTIVLHVYLWSFVVVVF